MWLSESASLLTPHGKLPSLTKHVSCHILKALSWAPTTLCVTANTRQAHIQAVVLIRCWRPWIALFYLVIYVFIDLLFTIYID